MKFSLAIVSSWLFLLVGIIHSVVSNGCGNMKECTGKINRRSIKAAHSCPKDDHGKKNYGTCVPHKENGKVTMYCCKEHNTHTCNANQEQYGHCESDSECRKIEKHHGLLECHLGCCIPKFTENMCVNGWHQCTGFGVKSCPGNTRGTCVDGYVAKKKVKCCKPLNKDHIHTCDQGEDQEHGIRGEYGHCINTCKIVEQNRKMKNLVCDHGCCVKKTADHETEGTISKMKRMGRRKKV